MVFAHKLLKAGHNFLYTHPTAIAVKILSYFDFLVEAGFCLVFVNDSTRSNPAKLVSAKRQAQHRWQRFQVHKLTRSLGEMPESERQKTLKQLKTFLRSTSRPARELSDCFKKLVDGKTSCYVESAFQADSQLTFLLSHGVIDGIVSSDGDILGVYGATFLIKGFDKKNKMIEVCSLMPMPELQPFLQEQPSHRIFQSTDSPSQRILWTAILGNDLIPGGVPGISIRTLFERQLLYERDIARILQSFTEAQQAALLRAIEAGLYEPVVNFLTGQICYLDDRKPESLCAVFAAFRIHEDTSLRDPFNHFSCAVGNHLVPDMYPQFTCPKCDTSFCSLCQISDSRENLKCVDCLCVITTNESADSEESAIIFQSAASLRDTLQVLANSSIYSQDLNPDLVFMAPSGMLVETLRQRGVSLTTEQERDPKLLSRLVEGVYQGHLLSSYLGDETRERELILRSDVAAEFPWTRPLPHRDDLEWKAFDDDWLRSLCLSDLMLVATITRMLLPDLRSQHEHLFPKEVSFGRFLIDSARSCRPFGGAERLLSQALRAAVSLDRSIRSAKVAISEVRLPNRDNTQKLLCLSTVVPASMRDLEYESEIYLTEEHMWRTACSCPAAAGICHHGFVILLLLEIECITPSSNLLAAILASISDRYSTPEVLDTHQHIFLPLLRQLRADPLLTIAGMQDELLPPNDQPQGRRHSFSSEHSRFRDIRFVSPQRQRSQMTGQSKERRELTASIIAAYDPLFGCDNFPLSNFDWRSIYDFMKEIDEVTTTIGFDVVVIRAARSTSTTMIESNSSVVAPQQQSEAPAAHSRPMKRPRSSFRCSFLNCECNNLLCTQRPWSCAPAQSQAKNEKIRSARNRQRREFLRRIGLLAPYPSGDIRICGCHPMADGLPLSEGIRHFNHPGNELARVPADPLHADGVDPTQREIAQLVEENERLNELNDELKKENEALKRQLASADGRSTTTKVAISDEFLQAYTRFRSLCHLRAYLALLCNADFNLLNELRAFDYDKITANGYINSHRKRKKARPLDLSIIEESVIYFARTCGHQASQLKILFHIGLKRIRLIVLKWAKFENLRVHGFGKFLNWEDHEALLHPSWKSLFPAVRVHLWDTTDLPLAGKPSDHKMQSLFFNTYYNDDVVKAGVGMTPFGWLFSGPLFTGGQSDSTYLHKSGIYEAQKALADQDAGPPCLNFTDRGFKDAANGWEQFGQKLLTPCFLRHSKFSPVEVMLTNDRANKRARNERAVRYAKLLLSSLDNSMAPALAELIWENNLFRVNFIFSHLTKSERNPTAPLQARILLGDAPTFPLADSSFAVPSAPVQDSEDEISDVSSDLSATNHSSSDTDREWNSETDD
jgi:hypothetical protein